MCGSRSDAGWRKEDGMRDDMWRHMAWSPPRQKSDPETAGSCPYALKIGERKEGTEWDAQTVEFFRCHLGSNTGSHCSSRSERCHEVTIISLFPESQSARRAATGLPET